VEVADTSDLIVEQITTLSEVRLIEDSIYWMEGRPQEQGRSVIVRAGSDGTATDITPAGFSARTRVHEYGGASWLVGGGTCIFSNFTDQRLYRQRIGQSDPEPLTPAPSSPRHHLRYSDGVLDNGRRRWIGVREDHTGEGEPVNAVVVMDLDEPGTSPGRVIVRGHDFFCSPRLSPDASRMMWLAWDHPNMPWNGTTLYLADIGADGAPAEARVVAGGMSVSVFQPEWSPDGRRSSSFPTTRDGGTCTPARSPPGRRGHFALCRRSSACRNGISGCRRTHSPAPGRSCALIRRRGSGNSPYWI
jgi:hypothetical protein